MALSSVFRSGWFSPLLRIVWPAMTDRSPSSRFKTDMPQIPGLTPSSKPPRRNPLLPLILGFTVVGVLILLSSHWLTHSHTAEPVRVEPPAQIEVPPPPPDPSASLPHADEKNPAIAGISDFAQPWSSADFFIRNRLTGENIPATIIRLPGGSAASASAYWAFRGRPRTAPASLSTSATSTSSAPIMIIKPQSIPLLGIHAAVRFTIH